MTLARVLPTPRGWGLVAGGLLALLVGYLALNLLILLLGVLVLAFAAIELLGFAWATRSLASDAFTAQRSENSSQVAVGGTGTMALRLDRGPGAGCFVEIYDRLPEAFHPLAGEPRLLSWWGPGETKRLAYAYRPERRGAFEIGPTILVAHDPVGLAFRIATVETRWPVEVIPASSIWRTDLVSRLRSEPVGEILAARRGAGSEFRSLREYDAADDFRSIVWKRSTLEQLYVRETESENRNDLLLLLDVSRAMALGVAGADALDQAVDAALLVARYAFSQGDQVGVLLFTDGPVEFLEVDHRLEHRAQVDRTLSAAAIEPGTFRFGTALAYLAPRLRRPTAIFAFTALEPGREPPGAVLADLRRAGHRLHVFAPDPAGMFPPVAEPFAAELVDFSVGPEEARARAAAEAVRSIGVPVTSFDRGSLRGEVAGGYARLRGGGGATA
ncbi:MAG TPA: DUF58 domain-containing protein [Thermoplasmata archaeon]|nr:DUF58 domain-containing protein [Thermoplasmata archaeon]